MKNKIRLVIGLLFSWSVLVAQPLYKNSKAPVEQRITDLLLRMTVEEKIGQLRCPLGWEMYEKTKSGVKVSQKFITLMREQPIGAFWAVLRADPWTKKTLTNGLNPYQAAQALNALQRYAIEQTRLGIPILFAEECPHGHMAIGTTVFPTSLAQASTWNPSLIHKMGSVIALEARLQGANIGYGPVLDIAREPRWSRMEETFGEDPYLTSVMGTSFMKGMQGDNQSDGKHLYSTLKHFAAYGIPEGGHNGAQANVGIRQLFMDYLAPFKKAVEEGATTIMTSYNSIDGVPCTGNSFLLRDVLRQKWGFEGFVFSDLGSIEGMVGARVAANYKDAAVLALKSGVDVDLGGNAYGQNLTEAIKEKQITMQQLDKAVANVLRLKFKMHLFENPYVSPEQAQKIVGSEEHKKIARKVAREGIVLLKNEGILPLSKSIKRVAVIGPNANNMYNQLGDYTAPQPRSSVVTVLDGIRKAVSPDTKIEYVKGCAIRSTKNTEIKKAVRAVQKADVAIVVVGGSSARDFKTKYIDTGAATVSNEVEKDISDMECGEGFDRKTLHLLGDQEALLKAVTAVSKPIIVIYIEGRPLNMNFAAQKAAALLTAWYPGAEGGTAIADILFGDYSPSGRLPVSIPRSVGQLPVYYAQGTPHDYVEGESTPLYAFGYGLTYSKFEYKDLKITPIFKKEDKLVRVSFILKNIGNYDGAEVVQLYVKDKIASVSLPPMQLKAFEKVYLKRGEIKTISFDLDKSAFSFYNSALQEVIEPGAFKIMLGTSSNDIRLEGESFM